MPEGDTIHRIAGRIDAALVGREIARAEAPAMRSPLHRRAAEVEGRTLERAQARGKYLLLYLSGGLVIQSHLGMNGRWRVRDDGRPPNGKPWLVLIAGQAVASQSQGKLLRLTTASRVRHDPALMQLGPDPLDPGFDQTTASARLLAWEPSETIGAALLDQRLFAGVGNVIRIEACFRAELSPWRRITDLDQAAAGRLVTATQEIMVESLRSGRRPTQIYGGEHLPCPRCGGRLRKGRQGDDARSTSWCEHCQH